MPDTQQGSQLESLNLLVRMLRAVEAGTPVGIASLAHTLAVTYDAIGAALATPEAVDAGISRTSADALLLARPFDAMDVDVIARALPLAVRRAFDIHVVDVTASTNADMVAAVASLPSGQVLVAELQTAGRGRRGRVWHAPVGGSLAFSLLWKFAGGAASLSGLSLAVGLAVARALDRCGAVGVMLKWPNDLLVPRDAGWAKLGGILIEIAGPSNGPVHAVIGIGLNLRLGSGAARIDQPIADLASLGVTGSRNRVLALVLEELALVLRTFAADGFAPFASEWNMRHAFAGHPVAMSAAAAALIDGIALGVEPDGALLLETANGRRRVTSGEPSLRVVSATPRRPDA